MRPEIVAPAGTPEKLETAFDFGADAVYLGLKDFSLRSTAGNFDLDQLRWAVAHAHERGRRVYVCVNIQPFDAELERIARALRQVAQLRPDAVVVADPGVLALARSAAPGLPLHLSTQASVTNAAAARFWRDQGVRRIIAARELSLEQLGTLVAAAAGEIEAFVHGAVCVAWSGRCFLSLYWAGRDRDPRRGSCAQGCRWPYRVLLEDRLRPEAPNRIEQDERGSYFFDAKDLCALPVLPRLLATGVNALKIEGRTRSPLYLAAVVDVYRRAVDLLAAEDHEGFVREQPELLDELHKPAHRSFSTHFLTGEQDRPSSYNAEHGSYSDGRARYIGRVTQRTPDGLLLAVQNALHPGEAIELRSPGLGCELVVVAELARVTGERLAIARTGDVLRLVGHFRAGPGALARLAVPAAAPGAS